MKKVNKCIFINAMILLSLTIVSCDTKKANSDLGLKIQSSAQNYKVNSPFEAVNVPFEKLSVNAGRDTVINMVGGTKIIISKSSFIDSIGKPFNKAIKLSYREFMDPAEILAAGIPMVYSDSSSGIKNPFKSAGMFELILDSSNHQYIRINPDSPVKVELASNVSGNGFSSFYLNTKSEQWVYSGEEISKENEAKIELNKQIKKLKSAMPFMGKDFFTLSGNSFLDIYLNENYDKIQAYLENPKKPLPSGLLKYGVKTLDVYAYDGVKINRLEVPAERVIWENLQKVTFPNWVKNKRALLKNIDNNIYELSISDGKKKPTVFKARVRAIMTIKSMFKYDPEMWGKNYNTAMEEVSKGEEALATMKDVYKTLEVSAFGIYNCDKFYKNPEMFAVNAKFIFPEDNKEFVPEKFFYVSRKEKIIIDYTLTNNVQFTLCNDSSACLYTVLKGDILATVSSKELRKLTKENTLNKITPICFKPKSKITSVQDIKTAFGI